MNHPGRDKDLVADLLVVLAAALVMGLALLPATGGGPADELAGDPRPDPALVHEIELRAIAQVASEQLPTAVRDDIGLSGEPLATRRGVLEDLTKRLAALPPSSHLELVQIALAAAWREDGWAKDKIFALAQRPEALNVHRAELDQLTRLTGGLPATELPQLEATLSKLGASRWLIGAVRARHLENADDPAATQLALATLDIARAVATRQAIFFALGIGLVALGGLLFFLFPNFIRPALLRRRLARELQASPFLLERTRRVVLGWFAGAHLAGYIIGFTAVSLALSTAFVQPLAGAASLALAAALIRHWGMPGSDGSLAAALTLTRPNDTPGPARLTPVWAWPLLFVASLAIAMAVTWFFEVMNQTLIGAPPETQPAIRQLLVGGDTLSVVMLGVSAVLLAPLGEEIIFRGFLYRNLKATVGRGLAVLLSGALFGLVHLHPTLFLPLMGLGMALAILYEWTGSLWVPIMAHMAFNLLTLVRIEATWRI